MSDTRVVEASNGRTMYFVNNKLASKKKYDEAISGSTRQANGKTCIVCGRGAVRTKFINLELINLCEEDYQNKTTGEIAQQLREKHA